MVLKEISVQIYMKLSWQVLKWDLSYKGSTLLLSFIRILPINRAISIQSLYEKKQCFEF